MNASDVEFQSPLGDFGFLKLHVHNVLVQLEVTQVSIPSRGFWFFEAAMCIIGSGGVSGLSFNPLSGILVF